jgi:hypothetical protein
MSAKSNSPSPAQRPWTAGTTKSNSLSVLHLRVVNNPYQLSSLELNVAAVEPDPDAVAAAMRALGVRRNSGLPADKTSANALADAQKLLGVTENTDPPSLKPKASAPAWVEPRGPEVAGRLPETNGEEAALGPTPAARVAPPEIRCRYALWSSGVELIAPVYPVHELGLIADGAHKIGHRSLEGGFIETLTIGPWTLHIFEDPNHKENPREYRSRFLTRITRAGCDPVGFDGPLLYPFDVEVEGEEGKVSILIATDQYQRLLAFQARGEGVVFGSVQPYESFSSFSVEFAMRANPFSVLEAWGPSAKPVFIKDPGVLLLPSANRVNVIEVTALPHVNQPIVRSGPDRENALTPAFSFVRRVHAVLLANPPLLEAPSIRVTSQGEIEAQVGSLQKTYRLVGHELQDIAPVRMMVAPEPEEQETAGKALRRRSIRHFEAGVWRVDEARRGRGRTLVVSAPGVESEVDLSVPFERVSFWSFIEEASLLITDLNGVVYLLYRQKLPRGHGPKRILLRLGSLEQLIGNGTRAFPGELDPSERSVFKKTLGKPVLFTQRVFSGFNTYLVLPSRNRLSFFRVLPIPGRNFLGLEYVNTLMISAKATESVPELFDTGKRSRLGVFMDRSVVVLQAPSAGSPEWRRATGMAFIRRHQRRRRLGL